MNAKVLGAVASAACTLLLSPIARAEKLRVDGEAGNNTMSAVFDAPLGERISAVSNEVSCDLTWDDKAMAMSGTCDVPLTAIRVDNDDIKSDHFRQWATNKQGDPKACKLEAKLTNVKPAKALEVEKPVEFAAEVPFTVCGRAREDGKLEHVTGTAILFPAGAYGDAKTIRVRAHVEKFNREAYHVGPKWTDGWLARVQGLAKVVAPEGTLDLNLFAHAADKATAAK
jgi:hypothetical protein